MKILFQSLLFLGCNALAYSAEVLAWKTPLSVITTGDMNSPTAVRLEKPPEASPFFGKDDELWNVSSIMPKKDEVAEQLEWAVWNATSGRLVAKGSWVALFELQRQYDLNNPPVQCRVKLDAYRVPADGSPPDASKPPNYSLSCIARSGQKVEASNTEGDTSISFNAEMYIAEDRSVVDTKIFTDISLPDCPTLNVDSSAALANHSPVWFARNFDGKQGIDLMVTVTLVIMDGTPFHELIMRQEGGVIKPFEPSSIHGQSGNIAIGEKHRLVWLRPPAEVLEFLNQERPKDSDADPFAGEKPEINNRLKFKEVKAPEILKPHFYDMVFDISDVLKQYGIKISDKDFVGYDPRTHSVFMYSSELAELDKLEQLYMPHDCGHVSTLVITSRGDGEMRLISRSGQRSSLSSQDLQSKQTRSFVVEPTMSETGSIIDLHCDYSEKIGEKTNHSFITSVTLEAGKFLKFFEKEQTDGSKKVMEVKAERFEVNH